MRKVERTAVGFYSLPVYKDVEGNLIQVGEKGIAFQYGTIGEDNTQEGIKIEDLLEVIFLRLEEMGLSSVAGDLVLTALADLRLNAATPVEELPNEGNGIEPTELTGFSGISMHGGINGIEQTDNK